VDLLLIRHAEPVRIEAETGIADPPLTEAGVEQARRLAAWLAAERIDHIATSPLQRARQTAEPVAEHFGLEPETVEGIAEFDAEASSYIPMEEMRANRDPRLAAMVEGRWEELGSMVEPEAFRAGAVSTIDGIAAAHPGRRVAVVCHGAVINVYLGDVIGTDRLLWFEPHYTSISRVVISRGGIRSVRSVNEAAHLR
jgi:2,3-bisphosphoglycerate-dependent phosphoglycerate mutase